MNIQKIVRGEPVDHNEYEMIRRDGTTFPALIYAAPIVDEGTFAGLRGVAVDVSDRKRAEEALRESEAEFRDFFNNTGDAIVIHDLQGRFLEVNDEICRRLQYSRGELLEMSPSDIDEPEYGGHVPDLIRTLQQTGHIVFETVHRAKDGTSIPTEVSSRVITYHGEPAVLSTGRDITDRKRVEDALRESEEKYRTLIDGFDGLIYVCSKDYRVEFMNAKLIGRTGRDATGEPCYKVLHGLERVCPWCVNDRVFAGERVVWEAESPLDNRWNHIVNIPIRHTDGSISKMAIISDITERKMAEEALRESEERYRHIIENLQDAYIHVNPDECIAMVSPSAARIYGYTSPAEMIGMPAASLYRDPAQRARILELLAKDGKIDDFTGEARRRDGSLFWASISVQSLRDGNGRKIGTEAIIRDITGRKAMEHAVQEANRKLNLLNTITRHDVANQLTALKGYIQLAELKKPDPAVEDFLLKISEAADTIDRQIAFTRVYQELGVQAPAWFAIEEIARKAAGTAVPLQFSGTCHAVSILADPMLERVFFNLFDNAIHHGKRVTRIAVRCEREPDGVLVIVEDDGVGIKPYEKEKIFTKGYGKNTGFGLFLAREILAITGITIRETGTFGKGARFEMMVPKAACRLPEGKTHHG